MRILVIEADPTLRETIKALFSAESFVVDAVSGDNGLRLALTHDYAVVLVDSSATKPGGLAFCRELRRNGRHIPILLLTASAVADDKMKMLNAGVDDYLAKPFDLDEIRFRVHALLRRPRNHVPALLKAEDLILDPWEQRARRGNREIYLTRKEFALATYLMSRGGAVVGRVELLERVWDNGINSPSNTVEAHIWSLRKKIDRGEKKKLIQTVPGRGYKLGSPDRTIFT